MKGRGGTKVRGETEAEIIIRWFEGKARRRFDFRAVSPQLFIVFSLSVSLSFFSGIALGRNGACYRVKSKAFTGPCSYVHSGAEETETHRDEKEKKKKNTRSRACDIHTIMPIPMDVSFSRLRVSAGGTRLRHSRHLDARSQFSNDEEFSVSAFSITLFLSLSSFHCSIVVLEPELSTRGNICRTFDN